jgi:hypothetical protein
MSVSKEHLAYVLHLTINLRNNLHMEVTQKKYFVKKSKFPLPVNFGQA